MAQRNQRQKFVIKLIKITVIALAAALLLTSVFLFVDLVTGDKESQDASSSKDRKAPTIALADGGDVIYLYAGETVSWRSKVNVSDNSGSAIEFAVDTSGINLGVVGKYKVTFKATDPSGNTSELTVTVVVTKPEYSIDKLHEEIEKKAAALGITKSMTKKEQILKIYDYVNSPNSSAETANIKFTNESNIPSISRSNWEYDWIEEAILTLKEGEGDCYSYYSLSKAFFEYFGIENKGIKRSESSSESGTHFWSMVNIGSKSSPSWYFYDATRLNGSFADGTNNGCLRTLDELNAYVTSKGGKEFYLFDKSGYPTASTSKIAR